MSIWNILYYKNEKSSNILVMVSPKGSHGDIIPNYKVLLTTSIISPWDSRETRNFKLLNETLSFALDITKTSIFIIIWLASRSNLFIIELMFKWAITIRFKFSCLITLTFFSEMLFVKRLIPDANSCWDPYSVWKSQTELKSSKIQNYDRKYFTKLLAKTEFPRLFRWRFLFPKYSSSMLLLSIKSIGFCWQ